MGTSSFSTDSLPHRSSNSGRTARGVQVLLRISHDADPPGIELVTIDAGPGVPDVGAALRDGHSTSGTLGIGLGSISRQADFCDIYSAAGRGTSLVARFWPAPGDAPAIRLAGLTRPIIGEVECGDAYGAIRAGGALTAAPLLLIDLETEEGITGFMVDRHAEAVRAVARLHRARALVLAGALMGGDISTAVREIREVGILVLCTNMAGSVPDAADLVVSDPVEAGVMAVMLIADTASFSIDHVRGRRF